MEKPETGTGAEDDGRRKHRLARSRRTAGQNRERGFAMNRILIIDDDRELCVLIKRSVLSENIEADFNLTGNHKAFCIPGDYDTNEFAYTTAPLSDIAVDMEKRIAKKSYESKAEGGLTVQTPLMMKSEDGIYLNIHEAALDS